MVSLIRRNHATYIVLTAFLSTVSLVMVCTSFATQYWIRAYANQIIEDPLFSNINYGLFKGTLVRRVVPSPSVFDIYCAFHYFSALNCQNICVHTFLVCQKFTRKQFPKCPLFSKKKKLL